MDRRHNDADSSARPRPAAGAGTGLAERLARLYRLTLSGDSAQATKALVKERLLSELGIAPPPVPERPAAEADQPAAVPVAPARPGREGASVQDQAPHCALRLRQLVEADAPWSQLRPAAKALFQVKGDQATAAQLLELAFLHGEFAEVQEWLAAFQRAVPGFFRLVHAAIRAHLVVRLWTAEADQDLVALLLEARDQAWLQPVERLYVWHNLQAAADPTPAFLYFTQNEAALLEAVESLGTHVGWTPAAFRLAVGRAALDVGQDDLARELLAGIDPEAAERDEALLLLLEAGAAQAGAGAARRNHYAELLLAQTAIPARLSLLRRFLDDTRGLGGFRDRNRPALNQILKEPLTWIPEDPGAWAALSELLVANRDLETLLPNLWCVFRDRATRFGNPVADSAIWQGPLQLPADSPARDQYWRGVAALHHYVNCGASAEASLWEARELIAKARRGGAPVLPFTWRELQQAAQAWVAKNHYLFEADRQIMLRQLRVAVDCDALATQDLEDYVKLAESPPAAVLQALEGSLVARRAPKLALRLLVKRARQSHLVRLDLDRLWHLACGMQSHDLAWRVATVVMARQALVPAVRHAWEISGEKRSRYAFQVLPASALELCFDGMPPLAVRLCQACLRAGPVLPELLALLDPGARSARVPAPPADSPAARIHQALSALPWLPPVRRRFRYSYEAALGVSSLPAFMQVLPANPWSLLVESLAERLGINAWGWRLSRLGEQITDLIPRVAARQDLRHQGGRIAKWLTQLTPEQRGGWQEFAALARQLKDDQALLILAAFVCRLATALLPNHIQALTSLQAMRAPVHVLWDLELWLVGERYGDWRKASGQANQVLVPNALQRLASIHA